MAMFTPMFAFRRARERKKNPNYKKLKREFLEKKRERDKKRGEFLKRQRKREEKREN